MRLNLPLIYGWEDRDYAKVLKEKVSSANNEGEGRRIYIPCVSGFDPSKP